MGYPSRRGWCMSDPKRRRSRVIGVLLRLARLSAWFSHNEVIVEGVDASRSASLLFRVVFLVPDSSVTNALHSSRHRKSRSLALELDNTHPCARLTLSRISLSRVAPLTESISKSDY